MDCLLIAAGFSWMDPASWWAMAQVVIGLGFVIFIHELGHFLAAKSCGVKCEKFYVGFDAFDIKIGDTVLIPKSLLKWRWGETEYGIGIIPLGGYVKMLGQDDNPGNMEKEIQRSMKEGDDKAEITKADIESGLVDRSKMDPRSFLAKSVPQRMWIISAGVIFNIIFAVIMAAFAFRAGVNYEPTIIGNVTSGGPAWQQDLTGIHITRINDKKEEDYLPFIDLIQEVAISGHQKSIEIEFRAPGSDAENKQTETIQVTPSNEVDPDAGIALIGVTSASSNVIAKEDGILKGFPAGKANPAVLGGDEIIKVDDIVIRSGFELRKSLTQTVGQTVSVVLKREVTPADPKTKTEAVYKTITTTLEAQPRSELGLVMRWEGITAIQQNSPAEIAGLKRGDIIQSIGGEPRGDLNTLDYRMAVHVREESGPLGFTILRGDEELTISVQPRMPRVIPGTMGVLPVGIDSLGIAVKLSSVVEDLIPNGPASNAGIMPGDKLTSFEFLLSEEQEKDPDYKSIVKQPKIELVKDKIGWNHLDAAIQDKPLTTKYKLIFDRGGKEVVTNLAAMQSDSVYQIPRGIRLKNEQAFYRSTSWSGAFRLGLSQTWKDATRVWAFLTKMVKGEISPTNFGGPGTIAVVATSEASAGTSRLLLFLTMLSANLAIINFLPIPVLDGGHMMFLAYEGLFRRPVTEKVQIALTYLGLFFILGLMGFVIFMDVFRISSLF